MVENATILRDTLFFVKDFLDSNITDPISIERPANQQFVMTSYPSRPVRYPIITIKDVNIEAPSALGFRDEGMAFLITIEIRVWARHIGEKDQIAEEIFNDMRTNQIGASGTSQANDLHDFKILSSVNVDEPDGPKSKIITIQYLFIAE